MKWAYSIQQKFKAALLLAVVCALVLITNLVNRYHIGELDNSFSSVIEDRLIVESYIYLISDHLYQKRLALERASEFINMDVQSEIIFHNDTIRELLSLYDETLLTEEEAIYLKDFKTNNATLQNLERQYLKPSADDTQQIKTRASLDKHFGLAAANLLQLSQIQIKEGRALHDESKSIVNGSSLLTSFEMVMLVCIAIILQVIVLASRPAISGTWQEGNLN